MESLNQADRNYLVAKIISGQLEVKNFTINPPSRQHRFKAEQLYYDTYREAERQGIMYEEDAILLLQNLSLWSPEKERKLLDAPKHLEELKFSLYDNYFRSNEQQKIRKRIKALNKELEELSSQRAIFESITCEGIASLAKMQYLICCNVETDLEWNRSDPLCNNSAYIDFLFNEYFLQKITDKTIRYLSRTDPWRNIWNAGKVTGIGISSLDMTDEQKSLILWSRMYDSIFESPDCPGPAIIDEDDMLDGWLIAENRRSEKEKKTAGNDKMSGAQEVFIPVDTFEDAKKVFALNSSESRMLQRQRQTMIEKAGKVEEQDFPDSKLEIQRLAKEQFSNGLQNNR